MEDKELVFGITEFFKTSTLGFDGTVKSRISDFIVNEVDLEGSVLHLTHVGLAPEVLQKEAPTCGFLDPEIAEKIERFLQSNDRSMEITASNDKDARRVFHQQIEAQFPNERILRNPKKTESGAHIIELTRGSTQSVAFRRQERTRLNRSSSSACNYVNFILYKENIDTMEAINHIGKFLRIPPKCLQYAGVKDKRAKTAQQISIKFRDPQRIAKFARQGMLLGNFSFRNETLKLGDLAGNRFRIVLRNLSVEKREGIEKRVIEFAKGGFINYFGLQRFGTTEVSTCEVGKALLKSDWSSVVDLIMKQRKGDHPAVAECRKIWSETRNAEKALRPLGHRFSSVEMFLLKGLAKNEGKDLFGSIQSVPRNMRTMYAHSYQSYLWNRSASYRITNLGTKPVVGDLVIPIRCDEESCKRKRRGPEASEEVICITESNVEQYSIYDVVLPLPGYDVKFPENRVTKFVLDMMEADAIDLRDRHKIRDYSLSGGYRHLVGQPLGFKWEFRRFDESEQDLLLSDADNLSGRKLPDTSDSGKFMALVVEFTLKSSGYATMALRELMKRTSDHRASGRVQDLPHNEEDLPDIASLDDFVVEDCEVLVS